MLTTVLQANAQAQIARGGLPTLAELLADGAPRIALGLIAIGGVVWFVAYLYAIRIGFRNKTYAIPLVAVCLNITWEVVHSAIYPPPRQIDLYTNFTWLALDLLVLIQVFRFGRSDQRIPEVRHWFALVLLGTLALAFVGHVTFHRHVTANAIFPDESGAISAFIINLVMSVLFVAMYFSHPDRRNVSRGLAWTKFVGTGLYAVGNTLILMRLPVSRYEVQIRSPGSEHWAAAGEVGSSTIHPGFLYFLFAGIALFDLVYLWLIYRRPKASATV